MIRNNIWQVKADVKRAQMKLDNSVRMARDEMMNKLIQLSMEEIKGDRANTPYPAIAGQPPMNVTGNLRRSIRGQKFRGGANTYRALVGPTIVYGRSVEMGAPYNPQSWTQGQKFPFMKPAFEKYMKFHNAILLKYLKLRG